MSSVDTVTWQALGLTLTLLGLVVSAVVWRRRGPARGLRAVAWSLLPLAAGLTGTLRLAGEVAEATSRWAARFVFSPSVWLGVVTAGVAVVLFVVSGTLLRRESTRRAQASPATGGLPGTATPPPAVGGRSKGRSGDPELDEIEAILRKHGIG